MSDDASKVSKLVALALHPETPIEEARTAALKALRLARRAGLELAPARRQGGHEDDLFRRAWTAWEGAGDRGPSYPYERPPPTPRRPAGSTAPNGGRPRRGAFVGSAPSLATCATCGELVHRGEPAWREGDRTWHADCSDPP